MNLAIVDASGNQITSFGGAGGTSETDDSPFTAGSGAGTPIMGFATADTIDSGDVGVVGMTTSRELFVSIEADSVGLALAANQLADGHNVTVDNGAGASAVNIQDGGNSITVDAVDLDVRDLTHASDSVKIGDGTDFLAVESK